jgi:hypothetical protein
VEEPTFLWNGNHALANFVINFVKDGYGLFSQSTLLFLQRNASWLERFLLLAVALCLLSILLDLYRNGIKGFSPTLLLVCALCALVIPVSVDYTLPMLVAPLAIFLSSLQGLSGSPAKKLVSILLILLISIAYATLLYPFKYKPPFLNNNFPALFVMLVSTTAYYFLQQKEAKEALTAPAPVAEQTPVPGTPTL